MTACYRTTKPISERLRTTYVQLSQVGEFVKMLRGNWWNILSFQLFNWVSLKWYKKSIERQNKSQMNQNESADVCCVSVGLHWALFFLCRVPLQWVTPSVDLQFDPVLCFFVWSPMIDQKERQAYLSPNDNCSSTSARGHHVGGLFFAFNSTNFLVNFSMRI